MPNIVIGTREKPIRMSYVTLIKPKAFEEGGTENYSVQVMIPKSDTAAVKKVEEAVKTAINEGVASGKFNLAATKNPKFWNPLRDGDQKAAEAEKEGSQDYLKGYMFLNAKNSRRPSLNVVGEDGSLEEVMDKEDIYSGCYGCVAVNVSAYGGKGKGNGVSVWLNHVLKTDDGERLDGTTTAEDAFAGIVKASVGPGSTDDLQ